MSAGVVARLLCSAVTPQTYQPGRSAIDAQNPLGELLRREHRYNLLSSADDVDYSASG
jgi:hypothetical protein